MRGDVGVRHAATTSMAAGFVGASYVSISRKYDDSLPALNLVLEPRQDLQIRLSVAKAMARPQLPFLTPGGTISNTARTLTIGNPLLEPVRATTYDLGLEWYPARAALVSVGVFARTCSPISRVQPRRWPMGRLAFPPACWRMATRLTRSSWSPSC
uniref:TonB-dependent receptor n=1 Tax=Phenylobacterium glaciei TaxID=2803784 RepID=A0A974P5N7_9CAUL|nr:TonB-dependent receptor [Phenylobacterium glaciei]